MLDLLQDQKRNTEEVIEEMPVNTCQIVLIIELVVIPIKIGKIDFKTLLREITNRVRPQIHHCSQQVVLQDILAILIWQLRLTQNMKGRHLIITQELLQPQRPKKRCSTTKDFPSHLIQIGVSSEHFTIGYATYSLRTFSLSLLTMVLMTSNEEFVLSLKKKN